MKTNIQFVSMPTIETMQTYTLKKLERLQRKFSSIIHTGAFFKKEMDIRIVKIFVKWK